MRRPAYRCPCGFFDLSPVEIRRHMSGHHYDEIDYYWRLDAALFTPFYVEQCRICLQPFDTLARFLKHLDVHNTPPGEIQRRQRRHL